MGIPWRLFGRLYPVLALVGVAGLAVRFHHLALLVFVTGAAVFCNAFGWAEMYWRLYAWWTEDAMEQFAWPGAVGRDEASYKFTVIVPALHEADHIGPTLESLARQDHPHTEVVAALCSCDAMTIAAAQAAAERHPGKVRLVVRRHRGRDRKAYQINEVRRTIARDPTRCVAIADAEGGTQQALLRHMEAAFRATGADVVQGGVQLMNLGCSLRTWFAVFAAMEYKAWFEGNMARQARQGVVLFGGNTVAFRLSHLERIGWMPDSLTEDGVAGILSALAGAKVAVAYSPELCTRELSPPTLFDKQAGSLFWQRVRWVQGYLEELLRLRWLRMPTMRQKRSAGYGLAAPVLQGFSSILLPIAILLAVKVKVPIALSLVTFTPLVAYALTIAAQMMHLADFGRRFDQPVRVRHYTTILVMAPVYQMVLMAASAVAAWRHYTGSGDWYRTGRLHDEKVAALTASEEASA
jgi:glycosyltransferase XagB